MKFSKEDRVQIDNDFEVLSLQLKILRNNPERVTDPDHPHIQKRLEALLAMTPEEFREEIEADYVIFANCYD